MKLMTVFGGGIVFVLGLLLGLYTASANDGWIETPDDILLDVLPTRHAYPSDHVPESAIEVRNDRVVLDIQNAQWAKFADTGSMEPVLSKDANAIEFVPQSEDDIQVGDICSYQSEYAEGSIIHRIVEESYDAHGKYYRFKGDSLSKADPGKVRFKQIERCVVAIVY